MQKKWYLRINKELDKIGGLPPLLLKILKNRGLTEEKEINRFLYGKLEDLHNPYLLKDMKKAVERINEAINKKEKVIIFGDYDVDGITAVALIMRYFKEKFSFQMDFYLPDRRKDGYGLNHEAVRSFCQRDYDLLLTVDCGITAVEEIAYARKKGLDVIVTDHHQAGELLPDALAVINPVQKDDLYPDKDLAGVGVAFKLCQAIEYSREGRYFSEELLNLLDIVTLGTIADIVSLKGENRIIVKKGLELLKNTKNPGLKKLINRTGLFNKEINTGQIAYIIAPHLNAAGRISTPDICLELLLTDDYERAEEIAVELTEINRSRQELQEKILDEAVRMVQKEIDLEKEKGIVLASRNWNHGIIGIVASKLIDLYYRPAILIAVDEDGVGKGSCRSINTLDIYQALSKCSSCLESYGGHKMAAGITINAEQISDFRIQFNSILNDSLNKNDLIPELKIDSVIEPSEINMEFYKYIKLLEPFGMGNSRPRFLLSNVNIKNAYPVGKDKKHLKFYLDNGLEGIGFNFGDSANKIFRENVDIAFHLDLNEWNGTRKVIIVLEDYNIKKTLDYYPVEYRSEKHYLLDKRGCQDIQGYLEFLLNSKFKTAVYINSFNLYNNFKKKINNKNIFLAYNLMELNKFRKCREGILFFTTNLLSKIYKSADYSISDIVFLSLPFSLQEMKKVITFFSFEKLRIHLLYSQKDVEINKWIIRKKIPSADYLRKLYIFLKTCSSEMLFLNTIVALINDYGKTSCNQEIIKKGIDIFEELGLVVQKEKAIILLPEPVEKLDLSSSISYNYNINIVKNYNYFVKLALNGDLYLLFDKIKSI